MHDAGGDRSQTIAALPHDHQSCARAAAPGDRAAAARRRPAAGRPAAAAEPQRRLSAAFSAAGAAQPLGARLARAVQHDLVLGHAQRQALADAADRALELVVGERLQAPAAVAHEMVMVAGPVPDGLVADHALTDLHALHQPDRLELVHHAIDARARDLAPARRQRVLDLHRRQRARLLVEQFEDRAAGAAAAIAGVAERPFGAARPKSSLRRHAHVANCRSAHRRASPTVNAPWPGAARARALPARPPATAGSCRRPARASR